MSGYPPPAPPTPPPAPPAAAAPPAAPTTDAADDKQNAKFELLATIVLGIAALATAWAAFQSSSMGGNQQEAFTQAGLLLSDANFFFTQGNSTVAQDNQIFLEFVTASNGGQPELAAYITQTLVNPNLAAAMEWWANDPEALTPFDDDPDNPYEYPDYVEGQALQAQANQQLMDAQTFGERGDQYDLATVLLAVSLFFAGISLVLDSPRAIWILLIVAAVSLVIGLFVTLTA